MASASNNDAIVIKRQFVEGPFGQVHVRIAEPILGLKNPPLVLFHPTPYSGDYFLTFMKEMAKDRTVIAIDTPGYGDSDRPFTLPSISDYAQSAVSVLDALKHDEQSLHKIDILGYHTGGLIAAELAVIQPDLVRKIALPGLPFYTGEERKTAYKRYAIPDAVKRDGSHLIPKWQFSTGAVGAGLTLERGQEHFNDMMQCYPQCWQAYHAVFTYESDKRLRQVSQPVLLITNAGSLQEETIAARKFLKNAELVHIPEITLGGFDLHAGKLADVIRNFLDK